MKANLVCGVDMDSVVEETEDMMTRGEERDSGDERMVRVGFDK
jgi:hypothetical protein